jgi:hypothetical protein
MKNVVATSHHHVLSPRPSERLSGLHPKPMTNHHSMASVFLPTSIVCIAIILTKALATCQPTMSHPLKDIHLLPVVTRTASTFHLPLPVVLRTAAMISHLVHQFTAQTTKEAATFHLPSAPPRSDYSGRNHFPQPPVGRLQHMSQDYNAWPVTPHLEYTSRSYHDEPPARGYHDEPPARGYHDMPSVREHHVKPPSRGYHDKPPVRGHHIELSRGFRLKAAAKVWSSIMFAPCCSCEGSRVKGLEEASRRRLRGSASSLQVPAFNLHLSASNPQVPAFNFHLSASNLHDS